MDADSGQPLKDNMGHLLSQEASKLLQEESTVQLQDTTQAAWSRMLWEPHCPTQLAVVPLGVGPADQQQDNSLEGSHFGKGTTPTPPANPQVKIPPQQFVPGRPQHQHEPSVIAPISPPAMMKKPNVFANYLSPKPSK